MSHGGSVWDAATSEEIQESDQTYCLLSQREHSILMHGSLSWTLCSILSPLRSDYVTLGKLLNCSLTLFLKEMG